MSHALIHALIAHVDSVFAGPNGDYPAILESLAGVTARQALWKPSAGQNSIWQIVEHLTGSREWLMEMLKNGHAPSPVWVEPAGDEVQWQEALARLQDAHSRMKQALEQVPEADLLKVPDSECCTLLELILSAGPAHDAHHGGQIDFLKGLQAGAAR
jgi:hypothetical protein